MKKSEAFELWWRRYCNTEQEGFRESVGRQQAEIIFNQVWTLALRCRPPKSASARGKG